MFCRFNFYNWIIEQVTGLLGGTLESVTVPVFKYWAEFETGHLLAIWLFCSFMSVFFYRFNLRIR